MKIKDLYKMNDKTDRFLVTCALPYVNNVPHLGNLVPILSADVYNRFLVMKGYKSIYICATDEHGTRTEIEAAKQGIDENTYCKRLHDEILSIFDWFNVDFNYFGRTSASENHELTQNLFNNLDKNGFITEEEVKQLYCKKDKIFLPDTYVEGICPKCNTPGAKGDQCDTCGTLLDPLELTEPRCTLCKERPEEKISNYLFLRLDKLSPKLKSWLEGQDHWSGIIKNMPLGWIAEGLKPRAITRDLKWGVEVPKKGYEDQVFYVWFDAPIGYIAATWEWAKKKNEKLEDWWKKGKARLVHFLGKDNVPFHTIMWPATLTGADDGWNLPDYVASNEYLNYEGGAFSKSRNRGVFSNDVVKMPFSTDMWRYFIISNRPEKNDTDFSFEAFKTMVNADLLGNLSNLVNRLFSFTSKKIGKIPAASNLSEQDKEALNSADEKIKEIEKCYFNFELRMAVKHILELGDIGNKYLQSAEPWKTLKEDKAKCETSLNTAFRLVHKVMHVLWPVIPETGEKVLSWMGCKLNEEFKDGIAIKSPELLFKMIEDDVITELSEKFRGEIEGDTPLVFEKEKAVDWPCVILEFKDINVRRRVNRFERLKDETMKKLNLVEIENKIHVRAYDAVLKDRDLGGRSSSIMNLINNVKKEGKLPNINIVADLYNLSSLANGIVMGAYDKKAITGKLKYAVAKGKEHFIPIKGKAKEEIKKGEWVIKDESDMVITKVISKESHAVAVNTQTKNCAVCIQGNDKTKIKDLEKIALDLAEQIKEFCGGSYRLVHKG